MQESECIKLLKLSKDYTKKDLKLSYQELSKKYHPDTNGKQHRETFIKINNAYKVLNDKFSKKAKNVQTQGSSIDEMRQKVKEEKHVKQEQKKIDKDFNKKFLEAKKSDDFVYGIDERNYKERTRQDFEREYNEVNNIISMQRPIFTSYNAQDFNSCFEQIKKQSTSIDTYDQSVIGNSEEYNGYSDLQSNNGSFVIPQNIPFYDRSAFSGNDTIIDKRTIDQRLNEREKALYNVSYQTNHNESLHTNDKVIYSTTTQSSPPINNENNNAITYETLQKEKETLVKRLRNTIDNQEKEKILRDLKIISKAEQKIINTL